MVDFESEANEASPACKEAGSSCVLAPSGREVLASTGNSTRSARTAAVVRTPDRRGPTAVDMRLLGPTVGAHPAGLLGVSGRQLFATGLGALPRHAWRSLPGPACRPRPIGRGRSADRRSARAPPDRAAGALPHPPAADARQAPDRPRPSRRRSARTARPGSRPGPVREAGASAFRLTVGGVSAGHAIASVERARGGQIHTRLGHRRSPARPRSLAR